MSLKPPRRSLYVTPKVKLGELHPLPEHVEEMAVEVEKTSVSSFQKSQLEMHTAVDMLSALRLDGAASRNSACTLSREGSFDDVFGFDSGDDGDQARSWQFSGDTESSGFGNSVTSFMSWTDDVEVEMTRKVQELYDELERCFYGEESLDKLKKEVAAECFDWRSKFPYCRVRGAGIESGWFQLQRLYEKMCTDDKMAVDKALCVVLEDDGDNEEEEEEEEEVIASHGSYQENLELSDWCGRSDNSRPDIAEGSAVMCYSRDPSLESLHHKVRDSVMEQLFSHVWSEVSKGLEPLLLLYSESTSQKSPSNPASVQEQQKMNNLRLSTVHTPLRAITPVLDSHDSEFSDIVCRSTKSIYHSAKRTLACPVREPNLKVDESIVSQFAREELAVDPVRQPSVPPIVKQPQPLSLHSAHHLSAPLPTLESRGYHSAAHSRTRAVLNRFSSVASGHERFLRPLDEQQTVVVKVTTTPRQVSAPSSPPNWSRHVTLPPIDQLDPRLKGLSSVYEHKIRSIEVGPSSRGSAKQKGLNSVYKCKMRSPEVTPRSNKFAKQKLPSISGACLLHPRTENMLCCDDRDLLNVISLLQNSSSGAISIQQTVLSKTSFGK